MRSVKRCKACGSDKIFVYDTRNNEDGTVVRKRVCAGCGEDFKTLEIRNEDIVIDIKETLNEIMETRQKLTALYNFIKSIDERSE